MALALFCYLTALGPTHAADMPLREIVQILHNAQIEKPADFAGLDMSFLNLSGLDFKAARLAGSKLHAADLTDANLSKTDLAAAILDRATIVRTNFTNANLSDAKIRLAHSASGLTFDHKAIARFKNANLSRARIVGRFDGADFQNANLTDADLGPYGDWTQNTLSRRCQLNAANFTKAILKRANLTESHLQFANFEDADLSHAKLINAQLTGANLKGANLTGADVTGANLHNVDLRHVKGVKQIIGLKDAHNVRVPTNIQNGAAN